MSEPNSWRNEGERCKLLIAVNSQSVTADQNGLTLVPEASVMPVVRAIKIMIGRKGFFGTVGPGLVLCSAEHPPNHPCLTEIQGIEKRPMKWADLFRNIRCAGVVLVQNTSLRTKGWGANTIRHGSSPTGQR